MKFMPLLILLLAGCSSIPTAELENQYFQCTASGAQGCNLIAAEMDRRYELLERREERELAKCGKIGVTCISGAEFKAFMTRTRL